MKLIEGANIPSSRWLGLDIGGANIKVAPPDGIAFESSFPLWRRFRRLPNKLMEILKDHFDACGWAVTMTGELADGFESKEQGVKWIVRSVVKAAGDRPVTFYRTDGQWNDAGDAVADPLHIAASNWHALATFVANSLPSGDGFLFDVGSTTSDIIPIKNAVPATRYDQPVTDIKRMQESQLLYTGAWRSPLNGILRSIDLHGLALPVANEYFATIADAHVWLGLIPEDETNRDTADGRPATRQCAGQRLARMLCSDLSEVGIDTVDTIAQTACNENTNRIKNALRRVVSGYAELPRNFVVTGSGSWLAERVLHHAFPNESFSVRQHAELTSVANRTSAAAVAVRMLAEARFNQINSQPK